MAENEGFIRLNLGNSPFLGKRVTEDVLSRISVFHNIFWVEPEQRTIDP